MGIWIAHLHIITQPNTSDFQEDWHGWVESQLQEGAKYAGGRGGGLNGMGTTVLARQEQEHREGSPKSP